MDFTLLDGVALAVLSISSVTDLRTTEVPDWVSYAGITAGIGIRAIQSIAMGDASIAISGLLGLGVFIILAFVMYFLGQWGGGDSKLLMAMGAIIGLEERMASFLFNLILAGGVYGLLWCIGLALRNRQAFEKTFKPLWHEPQLALVRKIAYAAALIAATAAAFIPDFLTKLALILIGIAGLLTSHATIFVKAVEQCCLYRKVKPSELIEGDWIAEDVVVNGRCVLSHKSLGVERGQIELLKELASKGKVKRILVKYGIPFVPSFLLAYLATMIFGNVLRVLAG